jgi:hypothetical protein
VQFFLPLSLLTASLHLSLPHLFTIYVSPFFSHVSLPLLLPSLSCPLSFSLSLTPIAPLAGFDEDGDTEAEEELLATYNRPLASPEDTDTEMDSPCVDRIDTPSKGM